jgi:hypothetical protein
MMIPALMPVARGQRRLLYNIQDTTGRIALYLHYMPVDDLPVVAACQVMRVFQLGKFSEGTVLFSKTMVSSGPALVVFVFLTVRQRHTGIIVVIMIDGAVVEDDDEDNDARNEGLCR